ncbi:MAG TPA: hypothetical protein PKY30_05165 [Myxococcota bacterium]|nr:hypothetical protein [Myxococcota bacterium]
MIWLFLLACATERTPAPPPQNLSGSTETTPTTTVVESPTPQDAASLYNACMQRVEGTQTAGECTTDADCAIAGCSREVCVPAAKAGEIITTCEVLPCFSVLSACGCKEGLCSWTVAEGARPLLRPPPAGLGN